MTVNQRLVQAVQDVTARVVAAAIRAGAVKRKLAAEMQISRPTLDAWQKRGEELLLEERQ